MKQVTTQYFCDRCGAEIKAYGRCDEIESGFGVVACNKQYAEIHRDTFAGSNEWGTSSDLYRCAMALCPKCFNGLIEYLKGE